MDVFVVQLQELLSQGYVQVLISVYIVAQLWWWLKVAVARLNLHYVDGYKGSYAVFVAAYRPTPEQLTRTLKSITAHGRPTEVIVVLDDAPKAPKRLITIAQKYATKVIEMPQLVGAREQYAAASEALKKRTDIIITVAADAVWDESTTGILAPFADDRTGAVSGREVVTAPRTFAGRLSRWLTDTYFAVTAPFQSFFGHVRPLSAHIVAARREVFVTSVMANRSETFLGRRVLTTQNESLTARLLADGYRTVYQSSAMVEVSAPESLATLNTQQIQRYRGGLRSLLRHIRVIGKTNPLVTAALVASLFSPIVYISLALIVVFMLAYRTYEFGTTLSFADIFVALLVALFVYLILSYLRHLPVFKRTSDATNLPLLVVAGGLLTLWSKTVALFTFAENTPQSKTQAAYGEGKVGRSRTAAATTALVLFAFALPLAYFALVHPQNVPLDVIAAQQGHTYTTAREMAERLNDKNPANDPQNDELLQFIRANGAHYRQDVTESTAAESYDCVRSALKTSVLHNALDNTQACYARALVAAESKKNQPAPAPSPIVHVAAKPGDTLTYLVRAEVKKLDTKNELSAAQAVYIETTYLAQTQQLDHYIDVNEDVHVNTEDLKALVGSAKTLSAEQIAAWDYYAVSIVW